MKTRIALTLICVALAAACVRAQSQAPPEPDEAARLNAEVLRLFRAGKYEEALPLAKRVLEAREKSPGAGQRQLADALFNLGAIEQQAGRLKESEGYYKRALPLYEKLGDGAAEQRAQTLDALAGMEHDLAKAVVLRERSLELREKLYGAESPKVAPSLFALAHLVELSEKFDRAEKLFARFAAVSEKARPEGAETGVAYMRLGCLLEKRKKGAEAGEYEARALKIFEAGGLVEKGSLEADVKHKPPPGYPFEAGRPRVTGTVEVRVLVGENGGVLSACATSGPEKLRSSSEYAAYNVFFKPPVAAGKPAKLWGTIVYNYKVEFH
ncbi:MAG TPA: tetratricopeptide repeat protein [Pyrinomonadaceae bacterium]|nr:tetratricopeptide repeat protein [Pyrinomonadaceae bacterium]